jgi:Family of unknown function (DUF6958)
MKAKTKPRKKTAPKNKVKILVENVNHPGLTRSVDAANYRTVRAALLKVLPKSVGLTQSEMVAAVTRELTGHLKKKAGWWTKCVQLDLEAKRIVVRDGATPLRWRRITARA